MEQTANVNRRTAEIQRLNDDLRRYGRGGRVLITYGVGALSVPEVNRIFEAIRAFDGFTGDNDPFGEHDCAVQEIDGRRIIWKIDYYDRSRQYGSPDPANPKVTCRVMTVMLAEEY